MVLRQQIQSVELPIAAMTGPLPGGHTPAEWLAEMQAKAAQRHHGLLVALVTVTPALAAEMLKRNEGNRSLRAQHVDQLRQAILRGEWGRITHQSIAISRTGRVLDGQHRLSAIVAAGEPVTLLIVFGVDDSAFPVIDIGAKRSNGDILGQAGHTDGAAVAAAARAVLCALAEGYDAHTITARQKIGFSSELLLQWVEQNPLIFPATRTQRRCRTKFRHLSAGFAAALFLIMRAGVPPEQVDQWAGKVATGLGVESERAPEFRLRARLQQLRSPNPNEVAALTIKAWNLRREGKQVQVLVWNASETFPDVVV